VEHGSLFAARALLLDLSAAWLAGFGAWCAAWATSGYGLLWLRRRVRRSPQTPGRTVRSRAVNFGLSCWIVAGLLTAFEFYFAAAVDRTDSMNITNVSQRWFKRHIEPQLKDLVITSSVVRRYRDPREITRTAGPGQRRLLFMGDSFTFGHGVPRMEDRFSDVAGRALERASQDRWICANLSHPGGDLFWVEETLQKLFSGGYQVDAVVYTLCLNDIEFFKPGQQRFYDELESQKPRFFLIRDTYFLNNVYFRSRLFTRPEIRDYFAYVHDYYHGPPWEGMSRELARMHRLCSVRGVELRVAVFPFLHNLGSDYPFDDVHQLIVDFCRARDLPVLDLAPVLKPHAGEGLTVNPFDAHPNERAHHIVGEAIRDAWERDFLSRIEPAP